MVLNFAKIEQWCKKNNTCISALEKKCELGNATIRGWETSNPRLDNLQKVSKVTGISIEDLIGEDGKE